MTQPQSTPPPTTDTKDCPYCHHQIPTTATFCWYCARELVARPERPDPTPRPRRFPVGLVILLASTIILAAYLLFFYPR